MLYLTFPLTEKREFTKSIRKRKKLATYTYEKAFSYKMSYRQGKHSFLQIHPMLNSLCPYL